MRDGVYRAAQEATEKMGGQQRLAEELGSSLTDTHCRLMRKEDSKGNLQRAFLDYLGPIMAHPTASVAFLNALCDLIGRKHPEPIVRVTDADIGRAWREMINRLPPGAREGARQDIAAALGVRPEEIG